MVVEVMSTRHQSTNVTLLVGIEADYTSGWKGEWHPRKVPQSIRVIAVVVEVPFPVAGERRDLVDEPRCQPVVRRSIALRSANESTIPGKQAHASNEADGD